MSDPTPQLDHVSVARVPRVALTRSEAAAAMGLGIRKLDELIAGRRGNKFPVAYVGSRPLIPVRELCEWIGAQVGSRGR